jgi:hypothetical protein
MSYPDFEAAAKGARKAADRAGLIISHMRWSGGILEWQGRPRREAARDAKPEFEMAATPGAKGRGGRGALGPGLARQGALL